MPPDSKLNLNARVLLVEDDDGVRETVALVLKGAGCQVLPVRNGRDALLALAKWKAEVAVIDIFMPVMDGLELMRVLRLRHPELRILAVSGGDRSGRIDYLGTAKRLGADECLMKPFSATKLIEAVDRLANDRD